MLYIFYGQDEFSLSQALSQVKGALGDGADTSTTILSGYRLTLRELTAACDTVPFLSPSRLVVVEGLLGRFEPVRRGRRGMAPELGEWGRLKEYVGRMPQTTILVLSDGPLRRDNPLLRELTPVAEVREFPTLRGAELQRWIRERVGACEGRISTPAVRLLAELVGGNLRLLSSEIEKLTLYASGRTIQEEDVSGMVAWAREANVFAMVDAVLEGRPTVAISLCHRLLHQDGLAVSYLLVMITRQLRLLLLAQELLAQRLAIPEVARRLGLSSEFVLNKTLEQARRHSPRQLREAYHRLLETDVAIKTGRLGGEAALDLLVTELSRPG